jgi:hypothetical protein
MNKAVILPIRPNWSNMIKDGKKSFEFRNVIGDIKTGTKVYLYESKGRRRTATYFAIQNKNTGKYIKELNSFNEPYYTEELENAKFFWSKMYCKEKINFELSSQGDFFVIIPKQVKQCEGAGAVVSSFVVGDVCSGLIKNGDFLNTTELCYDIMTYDDAINQGYTNQKYALEITNLKQEPNVPITEFQKYNVCVKCDRKCYAYRDCSKCIDACFRRAPQGMVYCVEREGI